MRKFWGWMLFAIGFLDSGIIWYNTVLAPWKDDPVGWVIIPYFVVLLFCFFGWYKLTVQKHKETNNAK